MTTLLEADHVLAVVVSYDGADTLGATVAALAAQVGRVHVVDNGSDAATLAVLADLARDPKVTVELLGENRGVGVALNRGVAVAAERGCGWLLTMDQDSVIEPGFLDAFASAVSADASRVCLAPAIAALDGRVATEVDEVRYAITSGTLVRTDVYASIGAYDEGFFVDGIDFDFSLRVRSAGHRIVRVPGARLRHRLGEVIALPAPLRRFYAQHGPVRRYFIVRNFLFLSERFATRFPMFILKLGVAQAIQAMLIAFFDPQPLRNYRAMAAGVADYRRRVQGTCPHSF